MIYLAALAVFAGVSINLLLALALGASGAACDTKTRESGGVPFFQSLILFLSVLFIWILFKYFFPFFLGGYAEFFIFFPLSALVCLGLELLGERLLGYFFPLVFQGRNRQFEGILKLYPAFTAYDGLVLLSLLITMNLASNFIAAFVLSLFFSLGNILAIITLNEIRRRSSMEQVPILLRGSPLIFISMGLLSFISVSAAAIFLKILEIF